ncbi:hypothetical protein MSAN_00228600 [Mycena sanguinolenta]|uniref:Uncharacterized protein n=1 Tax=Mycena sanguinolenta TaxID=230812 RepID=A0A8H6ZJG4_9AGAR|nr:hypothetical protein MSAN_00228600 [Mycena sanguinolenta]
MRKALQESQMLTATHDNAAAWAGIGSALSRFSTLQPRRYFHCKLLIHLNQPRPQRRGFPILNFTAYDMSSELGRFEAWQNIHSYASSSLYFLPYTLRVNTSVGLHGGSLYDVPNVNIGNVTVAAIGFNVTCGYLTPTTITTAVESTPTSPIWNVNVDGEQQYYPVPEFDGARSANGTYVIHGADGNGTVSGLDMILSWGSEKNSMILDSSGNNGARVLLNPGEFPFYTQLLRCSLLTVNQTAVINAQSQEVLELEPSLLKTHSIWSPASPSLLGPQDYLDPLAKPGISLADVWQALYISSPAPADYGGSITDLVLNQNLNNAGEFFTSSNITLHDFENSLSIIVASMFWTLTYIPPLDRDPTLVLSPVRLQGGQAIAIQPSTELSIIAIVAGLGASIGLALLSLQFSRFHTNRTQADTPINGTGFLQAIWLYRNHPELEILMDQVECPTEDNLRAAGMIPIRLVEQSFPTRRRKY